MTQQQLHNSSVYQHHCVGWSFNNTVPSVWPKVNLSGRVKDSGAKQALAKQLGGLNNDLAFVDEATGVIKSKKPKKEKTPEEESLGEMKKLQKKCLCLSFGHYSTIIESSGIQNYIVSIYSGSPGWLRMCRNGAKVLCHEMVLIWSPIYVGPPSEVEGAVEWASLLYWWACMCAQFHGTGALYDWLM